MSDKFTEIWARVNGARSPLTTSAIFRFAAAVEEAEREACAKVCEAISDQHSWDRRSADLAQACRDAIRARGNHDNRNTETT